MAYFQSTDWQLNFDKISKEPILSRWTYTSSKLDKIANILYPVSNSTVCRLKYIVIGDRLDLSLNDYRLFLLILND